MTASAPAELQRLGCDAFERGLLPVARHFLTAFQQPGVHTWQAAYTIAAERWGDAIGFAIAHAMGKLIGALLRSRSDGVGFHDPLDPDARTRLSRDESDLMIMLHHMRRDDTAKARDAVEALTRGRMDPDVIRTGLSLATRFSAGAAITGGRRPTLSVVG